MIIIMDYLESKLMIEALRHPPILVLPKPVESKRVVEAVDLALNGSTSQRSFFERSEK